MRPVAGVFGLAGPRLRLDPGIGVELDHVAVGVADEDGPQVLERKLAAERDAVLGEKPLGGVEGGHPERDVGDARILLVHVHQDIPVVGRVGRPEQVEHDA